MITSFRLSLRHASQGWAVGGLALVASLVGLWLASGSGQSGAALPAVAAEEVLAQAQEPIVPLPLHMALDPAKVALGERLFYDPRLSGSNTMACATCHHLDHGGADGLPQSMGATGTPLPRNTPTIFNVAFNATLNWDGGARTLEEHAERILLSPQLLHSAWPALLAKLQAIPDYYSAFASLYPGRLRAAHVLEALTTYERSLVTPNARFDRYLRGDAQALSLVEQRGYTLFKAYGCVACHQGINVGGNMFQKFGVMQEAPTPVPPSRPLDLGRFLRTQVARDRGVFRVPSLRNVALTAPYFHDGRAPTLAAAVTIMARVQLGRTLSAEDTQAIVRFLHTLTGEYRGQPLATAMEKD